LVLGHEWDILIMDFPQTISIKFKNKITFISDSEYKFEKIVESGYSSWSAESYFKTTDPNLN